jgi:hypothetical protein
MIGRESQPWWFLDRYELEIVSARYCRGKLQWGNNIDTLNYFPTTDIFLPTSCVDLFFSQLLTDAHSYTQGSIGIHNMCNIVIQDSSKSQSAQIEQTKEKVRKGKPSLDFRSRDVGHRQTSPSWRSTDPPFFSPGHKCQGQSRRNRHSRLQ